MLDACIVWGEVVDCAGAPLYVFVDVIRSARFCKLSYIGSVGAFVSNLQ